MRYECAWQCWGLGFGHFMRARSKMAETLASGGFLDGYFIH